MDSDHSARWLAHSRRRLGNTAFDAAETAGRALDFDTAMNELESWLHGERDP